MARRPLAAALILGAGALVLTGCIPLPPALPAAPTAAPVDPAEPSDTAAAPSADSEETEQPSEPAAGAYDFTVDDGLGDTWSFTVTDLELNPPIETGEPEPGTSFVGIVIDAAHVEGGSLGFVDCFEIMVTGSDGVTYDWADTVVTVTAEDDVYDADVAGFTQARAVVQLPEGVDPAQLVFRSAFGHPQVEDTVIDVE